MKGFKDGMKDGGAADAPAAPAPNGQVTNSAQAAEKTTIDVEAKSRS